MQRETFYKIATATPPQPAAVVMNMHNKFLIKINFLFAQTWDYSSAIINVKTSNGSLLAFSFSIIIIIVATSNSDDKDS